MDVIRYRDFFLTDRSSWPHSWKDLDEEFKNPALLEQAKQENYWPSRIVKKGAIDENIAKISSNYLGEEAPHEICLSPAVIERTMMRISLVGRYGPDVFMEATIEPIKTMKRDILPRFLASELYQKLLARLETCNPLPPASDLTFIPPSSRLIDHISSLDEIPPDRRFGLREILECQILYTEFLTFLRGRVCSENLICLRIIMVFEELIVDPDPEAQALALDEAWNLYRFFIASGSAYEVSLSYSHRKQLMLSLAKPAVDTFSEVKKSAVTMLRSNLELYQRTPEYEGLATLLRERKMQEDRQKLGSMPSLSHFNCFGK